MQGQTGPPAGARRGPGRPLRWMAAQRQNPAYRPATGKPRSGGAFLFEPDARTQACSSLAKTSAASRASDAAPRAACTLRSARLAHAAPRPARARQPASHLQMREVRFDQLAIAREDRPRDRDQLERRLDVATRLYAAARDRKRHVLAALEVAVGSL